ncbi:unnamed protein product [Protopolystoma xenopodis]|uniref:Neurotransmitter-gated ion-channel ligand-binding domain-containing protein n=1 Tax=Protopolystoma xenopodis TaxID=117903 RepID=A0A3S5C3Y4_9PLAT|nr:unnamed protein product [Protopolystoma xenopodis]
MMADDPASAAYSEYGNMQSEEPYGGEDSRRSVPAEERGKYAEKLLIKHLLHDYDPRARPVVDAMSPKIFISKNFVRQITVSFGMSLIQILDLNENEQVLTTNVQTLYVSCR